MKTNYNVLKAIILGLLFSCNSWSQATIAQWDFNAATAAEVPGGVSAPTPAIGAGSASLISLTLAATFAGGNTSTGTLETETPNFGWNTTGYPAAGTASKTAGVQFNVSTVNQAGIVFRFEQRLSNTSANTYVAQYTADNTATVPTWIDAETFAVTPAATGTGDTWYNARIADLSTITALDDNPNVGFRVVSAFDTAAGDYLAARSTSTYAGGTVRYDMVTITSNTSLATNSFTAANTDFIVSPNPSNKEIVSLNNLQDIEVYDASGKVILVAKNTRAIDTKTFQSGVYFIKTATGLTQKLIVR